MNEASVDDLSAAARIPHTPKRDTARLGRMEFPADQMNEAQRREFSEGIRMAIEALEEGGKEAAVENVPDPFTNTGNIRGFYM